MTGSTVVAIVHGLSEVEFCGYVARMTKVNIQVYSREGGHRCIQIRDMRGMMSEPPFDSYRNLHERFSKLEYIPQVDRKSFSEDRSEMPRLRVFPIMDTDDSPIQEYPYRTGDLFSDVPLRRHIVPIYNIRNLDEVFDRYGCPIDRSNKRRSITEILRGLDFKDFHRFLKRDDGTNLDLFLKHCVSCNPSRQNLLTA